MREDFLEPLPNVKTAATLVFGTTKAVCFVVSSTLSGFQVAVPGVSRYEGDPRMMLVINNKNYPVKLTLQAQHAGGYSYDLKLIEETLPVREQSSRGILKLFQHSRSSAIALFAVVGASCFCMATASDKLPLLSLQGLRKEALGWWSSVVSHEGRVPGRVPADNTLAVDENSPGKSRSKKQPVEIPSDSMISPASLSVSVETSPATSIRRSIQMEAPAYDDEEVPQGRQPRNRMQGSSPRKVEVDGSLKSLLDAGRVGRMQCVTAAAIPWLFESGEFSEDSSLRMSDAAWLDLKQFELGLRNLSRQTSAEAIESLQQTLISAHSGDRTARSVPGMRDVQVIASADARIYFRSIEGRTELVRILPRDAN